MHVYVRRGITVAALVALTAVPAVTTSVDAAMAAPAKGKVTLKVTGKGCPKAKAGGSIWDRVVKTTKKSGTLCTLTVTDTTQGSKLVFKVKIYKTKGKVKAKLSQNRPLLDIRYDGIYERWIMPHPRSVTRGGKWYGTSSRPHAKTVTVAKKNTFRGKFFVYVEKYDTVRKNERPMITSWLHSTKRLTVRR